MADDVGEINLEAPLSGIVGIPIPVLFNYAPIGGTNGSVLVGLSTTGTGTFDPPSVTIPDGNSTHNAALEFTPTSVGSHILSPEPALTPNGEILAQPISFTADPAPPPPFSPPVRPRSLSLASPAPAGVAYYDVYRSGSYLGTVTEPFWTGKGDAGEYGFWAYDEEDRLLGRIAARVA